MKNSLNLRQILNTILDFIFPKQCINCGKIGSYLCHFCKKHFIEYQTVNTCHVCKSPIFKKDNQFVHKLCKENTSLKQVTVALKYTDLVEQIMKEVKYNDYFDIVNLIVELMTASINISKFNNAIFIPIPLHRYKKWKRGFNQAELIAMGIAKVLSRYGANIKVVNLIKRTRNTRTQVGMSKESRGQNLKEAFKVDRKVFDKHSDEIFSGKYDIVLIDDVMTTGTTLEGCADVLVREGIRDVSALVFARG